MIHARVCVCVGVFLSERERREGQTNGDRHGGKMIGVKGGRPKKKRRSESESENVFRMRD